MKALATFSVISTHNSHLWMEPAAASVTSLMILVMASTVDLPFLNPYWLSESLVCVNVKKFSIRLHNIISYNFPVVSSMLSGR